MGEKLRKEGYGVVTASSRQGKFLRLGEMDNAWINVVELIWGAIGG